MNKLAISIWVILCFQFLFLANNFMYAQTKKQVNKKVSKASTNNYTGTYYKGNYVWAGAMNLAWNDCSEQIIKEKIQINSNDKSAINLVNKLNHPAFTTKDLDAKSYYVKSGFGQATVQQINKETKAKFQQKTFADLTDVLGDSDMIAYSYFFKKTQYVSSLSSTETTFKGVKVAGFGTEAKDDKRNIKIIEYINKNKFIVSIALKDTSDQLILAKGYDMSNPEIVVNIIRKKINDYHESMEYKDYFEAPKLDLEYHRDYVELVNKTLLNKGFENYQIKKMYQNIKFGLDETGAKVEDEAIMDAIPVSFDPNDQTIPKLLQFDKPFWVIMKRTSSKNPYFILGINNNELMKKLK